jgi:predicted transcriptional regulator
MKTAISIPDEVFAEAEELAKALKVSRSRLYTRAVREYVARHGTERVTEALDVLFADDEAATAAAEGGRGAAPGVAGGRAAPDGFATAAALRDAEW